MAQYYKRNSDYSERNNDVFEVVMLATKDGVVVNNDSPLPVTLGSENITITGNVNVGSVVSVESSDADPVHVHLCGIDINGGSVPVEIVKPQVNGFFSFNNFNINQNRGWTMAGTNIPMFAVRVKPGSDQKFKLVNYDIGNNNANQSTIGYTWYNAPNITGPSWAWVEIGSSGIEYAIFTDAYGSNTPNSLSGGNLSHCGIIIGKTNSDMTPEMTEMEFTDGGMTMVCAVKRLDSTNKLDVWFGVTMIK